MGGADAGITDANKRVRVCPGLTKTAQCARKGGYRHCSELSYNFRRWFQYLTGRVTKAGDHITICI